MEFFRECNNRIYSIRIKFHNRREIMLTSVVQKKNSRRRSIDYHYLVVLALNVTENGKRRGLFFFFFLDGFCRSGSENISRISSPIRFPRASQNDIISKSAGSGEGECGRRRVIPWSSKRGRNGKWNGGRHGTEESSMWRLLSILKRRINMKLFSRIGFLSPTER